jgi:hypothetical protein
MSQTKKPSFALYPLLTDKIVSSVRQHLPGKARKSLSDSQVLADFVRRQPDIQNDHSFYIMAEELFLQANDSQVIFPETSTVLDNLLRARFSLESIEGFDLPFTAFILSVPRGYAHSGVKLPSLMVSWVKEDGYKGEVLKPFLNHIHVPDEKVSFSELPSDGMLSLVYLDQGGERSRTVIYGADIPILLSAKNPADYRAAMVRQGLIKSEDDLDESDRDIQFYGLRLIAALGVYHVATQGRKLKPGFPTPQAPKMDGRRAEQQVAPVTLLNSAPPRADSDDSASAASAHYRSWHFRQLRDIRFYKGEFSHYAPGTRYVFVEAAMVGLGGQANTQQ